MLFTGPDGRRKRVRLGAVTAKQAQRAATFIEDLSACLRTGSPPLSATAEWVASVPEVIRRRLERAGLVGRCKRTEVPTLGAWLDRYIEGRKDVKPLTRVNYDQVRKYLLAFFTKDRPLDTITPGDADAFRVYLKSERGLADNTIRRRMGIAKQFFNAAVRQEVIAKNPLDGQATVVRQNPMRMHFVSREDAEAVLNALPDARWRLVFALCRWGGLRCPSEVVRLKWEHVCWEKSRFTVHSPKTEHHADGGIRVVPIFPELYPCFMDAFEQAEEGAVFCCPQYPNAGPMYRKAILAAVQAAGLKPWPKLFVNLRSTRETELAEEYPVQTVCSWIGNSPAIAVKHYPQVTEDHFARAAQNPAHFPAQQAPAMRGKDSQENPPDAPEPAICGALREDATTCEDKDL